MLHFKLELAHLKDAVQALIDRLEDYHKRCGKRKYLSEEQIAELERMIKVLKDKLTDPDFQARSQYSRPPRSKEMTPAQKQQTYDEIMRGQSGMLFLRKWDAQFKPISDAANQILNIIPVQYRPLLRSFIP